MKKKLCYTILEKKSRFIYGAFPRTKDGYQAAKDYKNKLKKNQNMEFIIK